MSTTSTLSSTGLVPAGTWIIDPAHSSVGFSVKHMLIATVRGRFTEFTGSITADATGAPSIEGTITAASIDTNEQQRDAHLRSGDFFEVETYPEITFSSHHVEPAGTDRFQVVGDLTIRGITRQIVLDAEVQGAGTDPWGSERVALTAQGEISRSDFGLTWNQVLEAGGVLVGDSIKLSLDLSTVRA